MKPSEEKTIVVLNKQKVNKFFAQVDQFFRSKHIQDTMRNSLPPLVIVQMRPKLASL